MKWFIPLLIASLFPLMAEESFPIDVDVFVNEEKVGKADLLLSPATESLIFIPYILSNVVSSALNEEGIDELYTLLEQFETFGFGDHYETDRLSLDMSSEDQSLHIHADPHLIARQTQKVRSQKMHAYKEKPTKEVEPSSCSAYLNVLFGERFNTTEYPAYTYAKREETANVDGVINLHNWVLQGFGYYQPVGGLKFNKGNVLLTRDFPQKEMRLSFGDINTMGIGFQNTIPMLGASIHKNGRLFTDATVGPASRHELFLNAPSTVEVFLDGIKLKTLQLRAGPHLLEEFPLFDGLNNVVLKIISPTGEERTLDLGYFYDLHELKSGESEYYFSLGVPAYSSASYQNLGNFPLVVGNFQYGFSDRLTAGTYLQALQGDMFVGGQASIYGSFYHGLLDFGASFVDKAQVKTRLYVSSVKKKKASSIDWQLTGEYTQPNFSYLGGRISENNTRFTLGGALNFNISRRAAFNFSTEFNQSRNLKNSYYFQGVFATYVSKFLSLRIIGRLKRLAEGKFDKGIAFNIDFVPRVKDLTIRNNYNSETNVLTADASYVHKLPENRSISASVGYQKGEGAEIATGGAKYQGTYMIANASHYLALLSAVEKKSTIKTTAINVGSSLVYADKTLAISKPIRDSFIIIAPNEYIKEQKLLINPTSNDTVARASYLRPAVLPISSYKNTMLHITSDGSMAGQMFENESIKVSSTHKSGSVVKLGDAPTHILEGRFVDQDSQPIKLQGGLLIDYKSTNRPCYSFFTDERGRFQLIGVPDGEYEVKLLHSQKEVPLIKVEGEIFLDLGDMTLTWGDD